MLATRGDSTRRSEGRAGGAHPVDLEVVECAFQRCVGERAGAFGVHLVTHLAEALHVEAAPGLRERLRGHLSVR